MRGLNRSSDSFHTRKRKKNNELTTLCVQAISKTSFIFPANNIPLHMSEQPHHFNYQPKNASKNSLTGDQIKLNLLTLAAGAGAKAEAEETRASVAAAANFIVEYI